jgi:hypothetical protein
MGVSGLFTSRRHGAHPIGACSVSLSEGNPMNLVMIFSVLIAVEAVALLAVTFSGPSDQYKAKGQH